MKTITNMLSTKWSGTRWLKFSLLLVAFWLMTTGAHAQTTATFNANGSFVTPAGVTTATVEAWGAGGAGGGSTSNSDGGGGGGGGAYSKSTGVSVSGTMPVAVGVGGTGDTGAGNNGTDSAFNTTTVIAKGGVGGSVTGGTGGPGGAGGLGSASTGATKFDGGTGGRGRDNNSGSGGPGGSSAGTAAVGTSGANPWSVTTTTVAQNAPTGGGKGGNGGTPGNDGAVGVAPGGGGGGAGDGTNNGGSGAAGRVVVTYTCPTYALTSAASATGPFCGASASVVTLASSSMPNGTYTVTYNLTGGTTATGSTASMIFASGSGTFTTSTLTASATPTTITVTGISSGTVGNGACVSTISANNTAAVTVTIAPTAAAGTAVITCANSGAVNITAGSSATNNAGITWTSSGTGTFANANSLTTATYTPSPADITAGSVTLLLTATGNGICANATNTKTLTINALPTSVAGTDVSTCSSTGAVNITAGSSANNMASITWLSSGTGTFANATSLTTCTYTPSALDISNGGVTITLRANGNSGCANVTSTKALTITAAATAVAGTAVSTCATSGAVNITAGSSATNNTGVVWSTSNGTGTFTNANSLTLCTYTPSAADIAAGSRTMVLTSLGNAPCGNVTNSKTLTINAQVVANAGNAVATCSYSGAVNITSGASASNQASVQWSSSGTGSFANSTSLTTCTYNPSAADITAGSVTLTLTGIAKTGCSNVTSTKTMTITSPPAAPGIITGSVDVCQAIGGLTYSIDPVDGANTYTWTVPTGWTINSGQGTTQITVTSGSAGQNGSVSVTATNSCGGTNPAVTYTSNINPVSATNNTGYTTIGTKTSGDIHASSTANRGYAKFPLSSLPAGSVVTGSTLTVVNNNSTTLSTATNDVTALGNNDPVSTAAFTLYQAVGNGTAYNSSTWSNTGTLVLPLNAAATADIQSRMTAPGYLAVGFDRAGTADYIFHGFAGGANAPKLTVTYTLPRALAVVVNAPVTANAGSNMSTCANSGAVNITGGSSSANNVGISWTSSGTGTFANATSLTTCTYDPSAADITAGSVTLTLQATAKNGCSDLTATKVLTINPVITPTFNAIADICAGAALSLPATSLEGVTGTWSPAVDNNNTTEYTFHPNGCAPVVLTTLTVVVNHNTTYYDDTDNDGFGDPAISTQTCLGLPAGYVTNNTDCAPADGSIYRNGSFYIDNDMDGYNNGAPAEVVCYGATVPNGLIAVNNGTDCNDFNAEVNVWHVEVLANGIDDNCDGQTDEVGPASTVHAAQCGATLQNLASTIYAAQVPGATGYRFEVSLGANVRTYDALVNRFNLLSLSGGAAYATTYSIRVAVQLGGFWQAYGGACNITTPLTAATTNVIDAQCGTTLTNIAGTVYCGQVTAANQYRFEVSDGVNPAVTYDAPVNRFSLTNIPGGAVYGTTYAVRVALRFGINWMDYGTSCNITTPLTPSPSHVVPSQCGITISNSWTSIYAIQVAEAAGYRFEVANGATTRYFDTPNASFNLHNLAGAPPAASTTYTIRVAILYNSVYQPFGPACNITTAAAITRQAATAVTAFDVKAYPNPYADTFRIDLNTSSEDTVEVKVYDMLGRQIETAYGNVTDMTSKEVGANYPSGVYNVVVSQGEKTKTLRVIKR